MTKFIVMLAALLIIAARAESEENMKDKNLIIAKPSLGFCLGPEEYRLTFNGVNRLFKNRKAAEERLEKENFPDEMYVEIEGVKERVTMGEVRANGYSLDPTRYVRDQLEGGGGNG